MLNIFWLYRLLCWAGFNVSIHNGIRTGEKDGWQTAEYTGDRWLEVRGSYQQQG